MPSAVWGLDIGHSSIKAVRLERAGSVAELTNFDVIDIERGEDDNTRPERVQVALIELLKRRRIGQEPVIVAVPGNQMFFRPFGLPQVAASKLPEIVRFEARQQIPFPINEVIWDYKKIAPSEDGETRVGLVAIRRELVDQILLQTRSLNLRLEAIQVAPLALYNLVQYELGTKDSFLVLDAGARVTDFVSVDGEEFWFRPLPQSGNDFTRALEQKFRMTFDEAEELKLKMGESKQAQKIFQVIEPMLRNLVGDIQRTIGYYKGIRKDAEIDRVLAFGGTFRLPGLVDFLEQALDIEIETIGQLKKIRVGGAVDADWWSEEVGSMGVALGLGLQGLGLARVSMEFLPESVIQERILRKKRPAILAGAVGALCAGALSLFGNIHDAGVAANDVQFIEDGLRQAKSFENQYKGELNAANVIEDQVREWSEDTARERGWVQDALSDICHLSSPQGEPAIGPLAAGGNGIHIRALYVSKDAPPRTLGYGPIDRSITTWYSEIIEVPTGETPSRPMIAILQGEVAGPIGKAGQVKEAESSHMEVVKKALSSASRVYKKGAAKPRVGQIIETAEDKQNGTVSFTARGSSKPVTLKRSDIERMVWYRAVKIGVSFSHEERPPVPKYLFDSLVNKRDVKLPDERRDYLQFTVACVVDDGSANIKEPSE